MHDDEVGGWSRGSFSYLSRGGIPDSDSARAPAPCNEKEIYQSTANKVSHPFPSLYQEQVVFGVLHPLVWVSFSGLLGHP